LPAIPINYARSDNYQATQFVWHTPASAKRHAANLGTLAMTNQNNFPHADILSALDTDTLTFQRGIEREGLRVGDKGNLSSDPHPKAFGSKLCHPTITTDFSESQLELITPVSTDIDSTFDTMTRIHQYITQSMGDETLWAASMPCVLQGDTTIPLADYGESNLGMLKKTYRNGLGNRYGRSMQTICAVHYNFSFPDRFWEVLANLESSTNNQTYRSKRYFDLMRNFRRFSWLPIYLFGASPAVCNSFVKGRQHGLEPFDEGSLHLPYATSLRSGNLGYQSDAQSEAIAICYNDIENYVSTLAQAVLTPYPDYEAMGIKVDGEYKQLNTSVLQSEAEFYSTVRAKRVPRKGENFLQCLKEKGVEYIEVRLLDIDPFEPIGVSRDTVRFLDSFLLYCLLTDSPVHDEKRCSEVKQNLTTAVHEGRKPGIKITDNGTERSLTEWAEEILEGMKPIAAHLDESLGMHEHTSSLEIQHNKVNDSSTTPSARILNIMKEESIPFFRFAMNQSIRHRDTHLNQQLAAAELESFARNADESIIEQKKIEAADNGNFDDYLAKIMAAYVPLAE
jgi:glutamate--cysteine ligase